MELFSPHSLPLPQVHYKDTMSTIESIDDEWQSRPTSATNTPIKTAPNYPHSHQAQLPEEFSYHTSMFTPFGGHPWF